MKKKTAYLIISVCIIFFIANTVFILKSLSKIDYNPKIDPSNFVENMDNKYFTLIPGTRFIYEAEVEDGLERTEVYITEEKKEVLGVKTTVLWDRVWLNDELIEDTKDWFAQDKEGNVWYFGEESKEVVLGKIASTEGSWEAGTDGAKPGIMVKANPIIGESYRQEYYKGEAEDMAEVVSLAENVTLGDKTYSNCLKTKEWNPLEKNSEEYKFYCPEIGFLVLEIGVESGERVELKSFEKNSQPAQSTLTGETIKAKITESEAGEIALERVPGEVTDISIETKFGKAAYVVEIMTNNGIETDVMIDIETGEVLGIET